MSEFLKDKVRSVGYRSEEQNYTDDSKTIFKPLLGSIEEDEDDEAVAVEQTVQMEGSPG